MNSMKRGIFAIALASIGMAAHGVEFRVSITNMAPNNGTYLTPMWFGFHDGSFDTFSVGSAASMGLERIAEDGNPGPIAADFMASGAGSGSGVLSGIGPIGPGQSTSMIITIDETDPRSNYFSFLSMIIPSNDAFIGNENPFAHRVINENGQFVGADFIVLGSQVFDAGTEVNDEIPMNTAFLGQMAPNTGTPEGGLVGFHPGFIPGGNILGNSMFSNADFTAQNYKVARITVEAVPEPATMAIFGLAGAAFAARRRKKS